ncbi:NADH-quinone oxidoreductase subunit A [Blastococcus sp. DSM 46786]|uniref:NADH-quinone oxidoreductase subunit A n=1 Tax=Blastococcus sp. DSM 46786 TaxID=1798227 RepID=UPI0008D2E31F|nr:NADH-quinone oxidoreductase subunit A [Blastococcus sp. DSM 46786]SEM02085.1 NADH-quinone oxidoreductase subunit A [Blastococcus sp. DSM 46786]
MVTLLSMAALVVAGIAGLYALSSALRTAREPAVVLPYESGLFPQQHAVSRYHARWYAVTVLFLAFDMEMIFMYPWAVVVADMGATAVVEMFGFLAVLLVGVTYVWREGALRWT